jgi:hypothetical protein
MRGRVDMNVDVDVDVDVNSNRGLWTVDCGLWSVDRRYGRGAGCAWVCVTSFGMLFPPK